MKEKPSVVDNVATHWEAVRQDIRDEMKKRIEQRDRCSIQLTIALAAIVAVAFSGLAFGKGLDKILIAAPLVSIYFTILVLYSYRGHRALRLYMCDVIAKKQATQYGIDQKEEWEIWHLKYTPPGIRLWFFLGTLWVVCVISLVYLWLVHGHGTDFQTILIVATILYALAVIGISVWYIRFRQKVKADCKKDQ